MTESREYYVRYAALGPERRQQDIPANISKQVSKMPIAGKGQANDKEPKKKEKSVRKDVQWADVPGRGVFNRRLGRPEFKEKVTGILATLKSIPFDVVEAWKWEKKVLEREVVAAQLRAKEAAAGGGGGGGGGGGEAAGRGGGRGRIKKADVIREENEARKKMERFVADVTRIRHCKAHSKADLKGLHKEICGTNARRVLFVEILSSALAHEDRFTIYEALWELDAIGIEAFDVPLGAMNTTLVYDDFANVEKCIKQARKWKSKETDLVKTQLVDMCDSLPPLSKFSFRFKLDIWQKRVLSWIDAGRSVIICAPTSSGKTMISSYVAFKTKKVESAEEERATGGAAMGGGGGGGGEDGEEDEDEELDSDEEAGEGAGEEDEEEDDLHEGIATSPRFILGDAACRAERAARMMLRNNLGNKLNARVLFVVPSEPLVWQVGAYFSKLLRNECDTETKVAIVTDQMSFHAEKKINVMPRVVVGTPRALESALTKPRGFVGREEAYNRKEGIYLPGGFDHFDWAVYDEVHALDGDEGEALQRLIRAMSCKFLALSTTVGNADQLRGWFEQVKGDQLVGIETIDVAPEEEVVVAAAADASTQKGNRSKVAVAVGDALVVTVRASIDNELMEIRSLTSISTATDLKRAIYEHWRRLVPDQQQLFIFYGTPYQKDLTDGNAALGSLGAEFLADPQVVVYNHVNLLTHQGRFINVQRYVWNAGTLQDLSPLGAVENVDSLRQGVLDSSSLSFTSRDSYSLWKKLEELYPAEAIVACNPNNFFHEERITLQRTKEYEDLLKRELRRLAVDFPKETQELLYAFRLEDPAKEFDLAELTLHLKERDMLPMVSFHLNAFDAIRLFQQLLAGLEWRQKRDAPGYYTYLRQEWERDYEQRLYQLHRGRPRGYSGQIFAEEVCSVDVNAPHPMYTAGSEIPPMNDREFKQLVEDMEKYDGFEKRDAQERKERPGENVSILGHALVRGLRRGIGLFINEVSFPAYRRAVMNLASKGKLAVVISDDSLAFGVNMPFRTCVFCGEMKDRETNIPRLTPLMAQQMSGRAGRRGLDTQGNLIYAGSSASFIRRLMIGEVSNITSANKNPRYPTLFLQNLLSPRHVGWGRAEVLGKQTLNEFVLGVPAIQDYTLVQSKQMMEDLGFIQEVEGEWVPRADCGCTYQQLCMVWELRDTVHESVTLGRLLQDFYVELGPIAEAFDKDDKDEIETVVVQFLAALLVLIDRKPVQHEGAMSLQEHPYYALGQHRILLARWEEKFATLQASIPEELRDPLGPGVPIDGTLFQCLVDYSFSYTLSDDAKQNVKVRLWHVGNVLRIMHNSLWSQTTYFDIFTFTMKAAFAKIKHVLADLVRAEIDFDNMSAFETELEYVPIGTAPRPFQANLWKDNEMVEEPTIFPLPWASAIARASERLALLRALPSAAATFEEDLLKVQQLFASLRPINASLDEEQQADRVLIRLAFEFNEADVPTSVSLCTAAVSSQFPAAQKQQRMIGTLIWFCNELVPDKARRFPIYLMALYNDDKLDNEAIKAWHAAGDDDSLSFLPQGFSTVNVEHVRACKTMCDELIALIVRMDEEDAAEDEEEEEDEA